MMNSELTSRDTALLVRLETTLWREETRFDPTFMDHVLAADFFEYGRSGRAYDREATLSFPRQPILSMLPLQGLQIRPLSKDVVLVTYMSEVKYAGVAELARRSSLWSRTADGWELRFHQGTPFSRQG